MVTEKVTLECKECEYSETSLDHLEGLDSYRCEYCGRKMDIINREPLCAADFGLPDDITQEQLDGECEDDEFDVDNFVEETFGHY